MWSGNPQAEFQLNQKLHLLEVDSTQYVRQNIMGYKFNPVGPTSHSSPAHSVILSIQHVSGVTVEKQKDDASEVIFCQILAN